MPDAVTNAEVEDVLSSIRRLVSEDRRTPAEEKPKASTDRLVLTPALRVAEAPRRESIDAEKVVADHSYGGDQRADDTASDADAVIGALMAETQDEEDHADHHDTPDETVVHQDRDDQDEAAAGVNAGDEGDYAGPNDTDEDSTASVQDAGLNDGRSLDEVFRAVDAQEAEASVLRDVPEYRGAESPLSAQSLSAKIAVLEEVIARTDDQWEPDGAGRDDYAGTEHPAMAWEDATDDAGSEDVADAAPEATLFGGQAPRSDASADMLNSDEDVLDEDALRDLVSDIVRQELQGALGERITRNVRKLVRREIHRALAAQELE